MQPDTWLNTILKPFLSDSELDSGTIVVFSADTDQTQSYVFESNHLPEIRGSSRQVAELSERIAVLDYLKEIGLFEDCLLFAGGGSILALLPSIDDAMALENKLTQAYAQTTTVVSISCSYKEFEISQLTGVRQVRLPAGYSDTTKRSFFGNQEENRRNFGRAISLMTFQLRRKKQQKLSVPFVEIMPFAQICESCHVRPAGVIVRDDDLVCNICADKSKLGASGERRYWLDQLQATFMSFGIDTNHMEYPQDIEKLTGDQPIALIYADGDSIGETLAGLPSAREFANFSNSLIDSTYYAICKTIKDIEGLNTQGKCNWEVITIGGDDVLILVPAEYALIFAIELSRSFTEQMRDRKYLDTRMSVGFTIGKVKTPIRLLYDAAKSALKSAKRRAKEINEATVDWHNVIKEGHPSTGIKKQRTTHFSDIEVTTGKPYSLTDADKLLTSAKILKGSGLNSQLYNIASELHQSAARGSLYYYYQRARLQPSRRKSFENIEATWESDSFPWITREEDQYTIFMDILDLI